MRILPCLLLILVGFSVARADEPAQPQGILILKDVQGFPATAVAFDSIEWNGNLGGFVLDAAGVKTPFLNEGIGRIIYFDESYYESIDHNQYWIDWRAGVQSHEVVIPPVDTVALRPDDVPKLQSEQSQLEDISGRYPAGQNLLAPTITLLKDDIAKLNSGLVLENGKWISAKDAAAAPPVPVVGDAAGLVTFTSKDGRKFVNAKVVVTDTGISVLTSDGGASVPFEKLPDDLTPFPQGIRNQIDASHAQAKAAVAAAAQAEVEKSKSHFWDDAVAFFWGLVQKVESYFSSASSSSSSNSSSTNAASSEGGTTNASPNPQQ